MRRRRSQQLRDEDDDDDDGATATATGIARARATGLCFRSFPFLVVCVCLAVVNLEEVAAQQNKTTAVKVGVVLDLDTAVGRTGLSCISMALSDLYASNNNVSSYYKTRLHLHIRNSKRDVILAAASALDLIRNEGVRAIIGPSTSMEAGFINQIGDKAQVPIISFSATSPSLSSTKNPFFIRATLNDSSQVQTIGALVQAFGWREAVPIYVDNEYGIGLIPFLTDVLQQVDARVPYRSVISASATDDQILLELYKLMTMQTRVFVVHMAPALASRLFSKAKEAGMMSEGYVWIVTDGIATVLDSLDPSILKSSMQGVLGVRAYVHKSNELENFEARWKAKHLKDNPGDIITAAHPLNIYGIWAHDAAVALANAVEKLGASVNFLTSSQPSNNNKNLTDLETIGVSKVGPRLRGAILGSSFRGLSSLDFRLVDGQLHSPIFEIVNVIGGGPRGVGYWTAEDGLTRGLKMHSSSPPSMLSSSTGSNNKIGVIIWPGEIVSPPKGWVIPTMGKRLKIGVPIKDGFSEFVRVARDSNNNSVATGFCIDVFKAVLDSLKYAVPYDFVPFQNATGGPAGSYNDLIYQVYTKKLDVVVGDTTIVANRSQYVDFTLPYTESGVSMIVPIRDRRSKNAWVFLKPLTRELWFTSFCFFIFTGFVVWALEHQINKDFRGPPSHQVGTILWFSFSTMVFAHREKVVSNLARFVVIVWVFVVLILTQSYTASLTSMLTVQQLQPTVTDINDLLRRGEYVGYQRGSFVLGFLKEMKFPEKKLRIYNSPEELDDVLTRGSAHGGIAAAFDEIPYMKLFMAKYCSKYTMVQPTYKTGGFAFAFPRGSPLVPDVSRAVLNVTEGDMMTKIEGAWFGDKSCPPEGTASTEQISSSNSLGLDSFWGLFLIAGAASTFALLVSTSTFLYSNQDILLDPNDTWSAKLHKLAQRFNQRDLTSHTFTQAQPTAADAVADSTSSGSSEDESEELEGSEEEQQHEEDINFFNFREQGTSTGDSDTPPDENGGEMARSTPPQQSLPLAAIELTNNLNQELRRGNSQEEGRT